MKAGKENREVVYVNLNDLSVNTKNSRIHSDKQVLQLAESIREFGFTSPILIDAEKTIIAGHGRFVAARVAGLDRVPCIELNGLTKEQLRAYVIADNKLSDNSEWDLNILASEIDDLIKLDIDVVVSGFDQEEIDKILGKTCELKEKEEEIRPLKWTRILLSIPDGMDASFMNDAFSRIIKMGGHVDYASN